MIRDFTKEDLAPAATNDTELTLGGFALFTVGACLLLLCAVCFGMGYFLGHRSAANAEPALVMPPTDARVAAASSPSGVKPGAGTQTAQTSSDLQRGGLGTASDDGYGAEKMPTQAAAAVAESQVQPGSHNESTLQTASGFQVQPPLKQVHGWMVQIAAVSHSEDAEVLVNALRKRGYSATARHDAADSLIHVQTGPFMNRNDANAMQQKLLNDGYNAIVQ